MEVSRTENSVRNIFWGAMNRVVSIVFPFIVRTVFINALGEEYLGLNTLFRSVLQVLNLADLGFASAVVASMYKPIADGNEEEICALLNLFRKVYRIIGVIILSVGVILAPFIRFLINGTPPEGINIYLLWILYLSDSVSSYIFFAHKVSLLDAHQRTDIIEKISLICRTLTSILQIYVVVALKNPYLYVILTIVYSVSYNCLCALACRKKYPQYVCKGSLNEEAKKGITKNISALAIQKIGNTVSLSLDSIIISAYLGLVTVTIYGNYFYIISAITFFTGLLYSGVTSSIGNSIVLESVDKNYRDFCKVFFLNSWIVGWCSICFICLFQDFMKIWMGEKLLFGMPIVVSLVLRFYFDQIRKAVLVYKDAAGMWWADKFRPLAGCAVNLVLNILLVKTIGVAGVAISTVISYAFVEHPWETHALFKNYFKRSEAEYYKIMLETIAAMLLSGGATYVICNSLPVYGVLAIAVKLMICIAVPNAIFAVVNIKNPVFRDSMELVNRIRRGLLQKLGKNK